MDAGTAIAAAILLAVLLLACLGLKRYLGRLRNLDERGAFDKGEFSAYRADVLLRMSRLSGDELARTATRNDRYNADLRRSCIDIMNRHEFICSLYNRNLVDEDVFDDYLRDMIVADHDALAGFFDLVYEDQLARGLKERRPLFPEISKMRQADPAGADPAGTSSA